MTDSEDYVAVPMECLERLQDAVVMGKPGYAAAMRLLGQARPLEFYADLTKSGRPLGKLWLEGATDE